MTSVSWLPERLNRWLTVGRPVTYWSFWAALLRLVPLLAVLFVAVAFAVGEGFALRAFAPLPFVFVAATLGYAVRAFDGLGVLISLLLAGIYAFLLWLSGVGATLLGQPTPLLSVLAVLAFVAVLAGFGAPTLHGQRGADELEQARREWQQE
ncbi:MULTISPECIES: hypothetical protein [Halolamina]|uniref:Uncharacterized protein n=1 Tax=Halolamina pelagica TaxID=699431 RepID=A0A1I5MQ76_9EURY|nr:MULTISPECIES: hypothetical protein [Halolamina]NHX36117.1 hypothetical protein [Halolamina sp. R1-12]SFP11738.1 hypothetical protein SAMN05216277_101362 [Halolamina pelagica]